MLELRWYFRSEVRIQFVTSCRVTVLLRKLFRMRMNSPSRCLKIRSSSMCA